MNKIIDRSISSSMTFGNKFIMPPVCGLFGIGIILLFTYGDPGRWPVQKIIFLVMMFIGTFLCFLLPLKLKTAWIRGNNLIVSNYFKKIEIPFSEIRDVKEFIFSSPRLIKIKFKKPTEFGNNIWFMAKFRPIFFRSHPIVEELKKLSGLEE